jgi:hypothetical protein
LSEGARFLKIPRKSKKKKKKKKKNKKAFQQSYQEIANNAMRRTTQMS